MHKIAKTLILTALLLIPFTPHAKADEIPATTTLKAATIFADRATLTRSAALNIPAGKHVIVFENLPANLFADSLRVEGQGTAQATLGALSHKIVNSVELTSEREKTLTDQKQTLENQKKLLAAEKQALAQKRKFLESLAARAAEKTNEDIAEFNLDTESWTAGANAIYTGIAETAKAALEKDQKIAELQKQINKIQQDLNQLRTGQKRTTEVRLPVEATSAGNLTLALDYQISGASWHPVYDARLDTQNAGLQLVQYGAVTQRTGEDWTNITLTLSTAQPHRGATAPHLPPMWVSLYQGHKARARSGGGNTFSNMAANITTSSPLAKMDFAADEAMMEAAPMPAKVKTATISAGGFTAEYKIPGLSSVPADGTQTKVLIAPFETDAKLETHIKPQLDNNAYLIAKTTLKGEAPILPGPVYLFRDDSFVGQTHIPLLRPGADHNLSFGIDDQIEIAHKTLKDERDEEGILMGKTKRIERITITEIQNVRAQPVDIVVMQTLPASKDKDIKLDILKEETTQGFETDRDNIKGLTAWSFALKPGEQKDIKLGWKLTWPQDKNLSGLR